MLPSESAAHPAQKSAYGRIKSTRVNGESANDGYDVLNKLKTAAGYAAETDTNNVQQLVKYSTKTSGGKTVLDKICYTDRAFGC